MHPKILVLVGGLMFALTACSGGGGGGATTITGSDFKFDPASTTVKANQPTTLALHNTGSVIHDWTPQGMGSVQVQAPAGQTVSVTFTPTQTGTFRVICTQPGHEQLGMTATLVVS